MNRIAQMIKKGAAHLSDTEVEALAQEVKRHPYCQAAHILYVHALYLRHDVSYGSALRQAAITLPMRTALFNLIEEHERRAQPEKKERHASSDRTESLITGFLDTLPQEKPRRMTVADAATDYMAYLMQTEMEAEQESAGSISAMAGQELIDDFIGQKNGKRIVLQEREESDLLTPETQEGGEFFTETMARIYIKQGKYEKAIKIIERLSTKVPRKNTYFADQMRFLRLLIENNKHNNK